MALRLLVVILGLWFFSRRRGVLLRRLLDQLVVLLLVGMPRLERLVALRREVLDKLHG